MLDRFLEQQIKENYHFKPTKQQDEAIRRMARFIAARDNDSIFVLKGYAGTGKTSIAAAAVRALESLEIKTVLLAPTGRAAKVFSLYAAHKAYTIHKMVYVQKVFSPDMNNFVMGRNLAKDTLFIIDEASMISNAESTAAHFGSGRLLDDLIEYVHLGNNCKLMLMGDTAQLPPVGEEESPALSSNYLRRYGYGIDEVELTEVVRQEVDSGILYNATLIRSIINTQAAAAHMRFAVSRFTDVRIVRGDELIETITDAYSRDGEDETMVVTRSNKRANIYNKGIRSTILYREEELERGDAIMIARNNYGVNLAGTEMEFVANGDIATVRRVRRYTEVYGLRFAEVTMTFPDYGDCEVEAKVILDTLHSESPSLEKERTDALFAGVYDSYSDIPTKRERLKKVKADPFFNALQIKYAYAVTCHKAQGGQWLNIFLDQGYLPDEGLTTDYLRWLYTAVTRAKGTLYLVNYPEEKAD